MKKYIIISIILLLAFIILFFLFTKPTPKAGEIIENEALTNNPFPTNSQVLINAQSPELTLEEKENLLKQVIKNKVRNFIERYGSFSSDSPFVNIYELKDEMSARFWQEVEKEINNQSLSENSTFYSINTKTLNLNEKTSTNNSIVYLVTTQREEISNKTYKLLYQQVEVELIKNGEDWQINKVNWK